MPASPSYLHGSPSSPRGRPSTSGTTSASRGHRFEAGSHGFSVSGLSSIAHPTLNMTNFISTSGFARPSYEINHGTTLGGTSGGVGGAAIHSPAPGGRPGERVNAAHHVDRHGGGGGRRRSITPINRGNISSPMPRSTPTATAPAAFEGHNRAVATPPAQRRPNMVSPCSPLGLSSLQVGSRTPHESDDARAVAAPLRSAALGDAFSDGVHLSSSPLHSTLTSSASGIGGMGSGSVFGNAAALAKPVGRAANPLRPPSGMGNVAADTSGSGTVNVGGGGGGAEVSVAATSGGGTLALNFTKEHCSHCNVEGEALYLCPCGLARYCSTTCQHAHWSFHHNVCSAAVRAVCSTWRRCDCCDGASSTLHRCGCGFAYYCDVHCQRADWPYHRLVCSTVASEAIVAALLGGPAPRTTREAATQTAHWQIHVPLLRSSARPEHVSDSRGVSGHGSTSFQASQQYALTGSDSFNDGRSFSGGVNGAATQGSSFTRPSRTQPPAWDHNSQFPGDSAYTDGTSSTSRSTFAAPAGHVDPTMRNSRSQHGGGGGGVSPRTPSGRHPRLNSVYDSLYLGASQQELPSPPTTHLRGGDGDGGGVSSRTGWQQNAHGFHKSTTLSSGMNGLSSRHNCTVSEGDAVESVANGNNSNTAHSNGVSPPSSFVPVRDQPSLLALVATSLRRIESEEQKEWGELCRQFHVARARIQLRLLPKAEEEGRVQILKEEVMWCVVSGGPAARRLKQVVMRRGKA